MFRIVFVCSGNQCRSPSAEAFLRARTAGLSVKVTSAGALGMAERPAPAEMVVAAREIRALVDEIAERLFGPLTPLPEDAAGL